MANKSKLVCEYILMCIKPMVWYGYRLWNFGSPSPYVKHHDNNCIATNKECTQKRHGIIYNYYQFLRALKPSSTVQRAATASKNHNTNYHNRIDVAHQEPITIYSFGFSFLTAWLWYGTYSFSLYLWHSEQSSARAFIQSLHTQKWGKMVNTNIELTVWVSLLLIDRCAPRTQRFKSIYLNIFINV